MADDAIARILEAQGAVCASFGSAFYGALAPLAAADLAGAPRALFAPWDGASYRRVVDDAVALRFLGALHDLALSGEDAGLAAAFPPAGDDPQAAWRAAQAAIERHGARLSAFMTHEPQTNAVGRSACLLPGFLAVAAEFGLPLRCLEVGASAGLNQFWNRYGYDLGAAGRWGDPASPVQLVTDWSGPVPALAPSVTVVETRACDRDPIDLADPAQRQRLIAYLWPDQKERIARLEAAAGVAIAAGVQVEEADAEAWTKANASPREGVATVLFHSSFWPYLPPAAQGKMRAALERHGAAATPSAPLAWLRKEPPPDRPFPDELRLTLWPGGEERLLAEVQAHGAWIAWKG